MRFPDRMTRKRPRHRLSVSAAVPALACVAMLGCKDPLAVETPDIVDPSGLGTPAGLTALRNGAYGDFVRAFSGDGASAGLDGHLQLTCLLTDECASSTTQSGRTENDARYGDDRNGDIESYYSNLHRAREAAEIAADRFETSEAAPEREEGLAELLNLAGYAYVFFGEDFCSGVPFSTLEEGEVVFGQPTPTPEIFERAVAFFDRAIGVAAGAGITDLEYLARVGKGRALLSLGEYDAAAAAVAPVPTDFDYTIKYSTNTPRQENGLFGIINTEERISVTDAEGINGVDYLSAHTAGDPRTPWEKDPRNGVGFDSTVEMFLQLKYTGRDSPIPLATGIEARMVEAEGALRADDVGGFETGHDAARATRTGLPPIDAAAMTPEDRIDFHFRERALWFWIDGHRLGDMRRLVREYGRDPETVFPTGEYFRPQYADYGSAVTLPVPFEERNNPNFTGCLSTDA